MFYLGGLGKFKVMPRFYTLWMHLRAPPTGSYAGHVRRGMKVRPVVVSLIAGTALALGACAGNSGHQAQPASGRSDTQPSVQVSSPQVSELAGLARRVLDSYIVRNGPHDPRYWRDGSFIATDGPSCWSCYDTAATAAAVLSTYDGNEARLRNVAIATFTHVIRTYQAPSGEFASGAVMTGFISVELGLSYLELRSTLPASTSALWRESLQRAADWLIRTGQTTYYINGNVNLRQTEVMWLAWSATGAARFRTAYQHEWRFTISPPKRWTGFGLQLTHSPTGPDGAAGAGYLAESGGGAPGYDPSYTMVQLDIATELYILTRDSRYVRLMNLLFNQERPRINAAFTLNATGGTRKDDDTPFMSAAPAVLVLTGQRPDLRRFWLGQLRRIQHEYRGAMTYTVPNYYKGLSGWLMPPILALQWPHGVGPSVG